LNLALLSLNAGFFKERHFPWLDLTPSVLYSHVIKIERGIFKNNNKKDACCGWVFEYFIIQKRKKQHRVSTLTHLPEPNQ